MTFRRALKPACLSILLLITGFAGSAQAHALPGSALTFSMSDQALLLSIRLPLEDLALASPSLEHLQAVTLNQDLPAEDTRRLEHYFADHLILKRGSITLPWTIEQARLQAVRNEHVGTYTQLGLSIASPVPTTHDTEVMTLRYDAVMHEVRNHRATVHWLSPDTDTTTIARFGYRPTGGEQQAIEFKLPTDE